MYEPVSTDHFLIAFSAGAMVLIGGAGYAMAFALSRMQKRPRLMILAWISYGLLAVSVLALT